MGSELSKLMLINQQLYKQEQTSTSTSTSTPTINVSQTNNLVDNTYTSICLSCQKLEEQPLSMDKLIQLKNNFEELRRSAYIEAYNIGCSNYVKLINAEIKQNIKRNWFEFAIRFDGEDKDKDKYISISKEYRCVSYDNQLKNKLISFLQNAYKGFNIKSRDSSSRRDSTITTYIDITIPEQVIPLFTI